MCRFAEENIFANRPLMDRYFNSYSIVNDTIARCVEQLYELSELTFLMMLIILDDYDMDDVDKL